MDQQEYANEDLAPLNTIYRKSFIYLYLTILGVASGIGACQKKTKSDKRDNISKRPQVTVENVESMTPTTENEANTPLVPQAPDLDYKLPVYKIELTPEVINACKDNWKKWIENDAAYSPFQAINKKWEVKLNEEEITELLEDADTFVSLDMPLYLKSDVVHYFDVTDVVDLALMDSRDISMKNNIVKMTEGYQDSTSLNLILAGFAHVVDAHFELLNRNIRQNFAFTTFNVLSETQRFSDSYYEFHAALGKPIEKEFAGDTTANIMAFYSKIYAAKYIYDYNYSIENAFPSINVSTNLNTIIIGDMHHIVERALADSLPEPHCLEILGYSGVTFTFETLNKGKILYRGNVWYEYEDALESLNELASYEKERSGLLNDLRTHNPEAYDILIKYPFYANNIRHILKKLKLYEDYGLEVKYRGLESY